MKTHLKRQIKEIYEIMKKYGIRKIKFLHTIGNYVEYKPVKDKGLKFVEVEGSEMAILTRFNMQAGYVINHT